MSRSLKVPGSPSSELHTRYFIPGNCRGIKLHLRPVGKPAPPRPRKADFFTAETTGSGGGFSVGVFFSAADPPRLGMAVHRRIVPARAFLLYPVRPVYMFTFLRQSITRCGASL